MEEIPTHVAFEADRAVIEHAIVALEAYVSDRNPNPLEEVLELAWQTHQRWRRGLLGELSVATRDRIAQKLEVDDQLALKLRAAPTSVRRLLLDELDAHVAIYVRVRSLDAPQTVVDGMRAKVEQTLRALDPNAPLEEQGPTLATAHSLEGKEEANLHGWLFDVLRLSRCIDSPTIGLGQSIDGSSTDTPAPKENDGPEWAGVEFTVYGMQPDAPWWQPASVSLPRRLGRMAPVVVGVAGGPATCAFAGDVVSAELAPSLRACVGALAPNRALVSFVGIESEMDWPW